MDSKKRFKASFDQGNEAEELFVQLCEKNGIKAVKTRPDVDVFDHFDFFLYYNGKRTTVDVKNEKKKYRYSPDDEEKVVWLEVKGISGYKGWLYGKANFIAIRYQGNKFIFIKRLNLVKLLEEKRARWDDGRIKKGRNFYETYTRDGRNDEIVMFPISDILALKHKILK